MPVYLTPPPGNPLTRAIAAIVGVLTLVGAALVGLVALAVVVGLFVVAGLWVGFKRWQLGRKAPQSARQNRSPSSRRVIDAEFEVISKEKDP